MTGNAPGAVPIADGKAMMNLPDFLAISGLAVLGLGLWEIHPPTAKIVIGAIVLMYGVIIGRGPAKSKKPRADVQRDE